MGVRYARAANRIEPEKLGLAPRRVLVAIALRAMDTKSGDTPAGTYFGGRYMLLGDLAMMPTKSNLRLLTRYLQALVDGGFLVRDGRASSGRRSVYRLGFPVDKSPPQTVPRPD